MESCVDSTDLTSQVTPTATDCRIDEIKPILKKKSSDELEVRPLTSILKKRDSFDSKTEIHSILKRNSLESEHRSLSGSHSILKHRSLDEKRSPRDESIPKPILKKKTASCVDIGDKASGSLKPILKKTKTRDEFDFDSAKSPVRHIRRGSHDLLHDDNVEFVDFVPRCSSDSSSLHKPSITQSPASFSQSTASIGTKNSTEWAESTNVRHENGQQVVEIVISANHTPYLNSSCVSDEQDESKKLNGFDDKCSLYESGDHQHAFDLNRSSNSSGSRSLSPFTQSAVIFSVPSQMKIEANLVEPESSKLTQ